MNLIFSRAPCSTSARSRRIAEIVTDTFSIWARARLQRFAQLFDPARVVERALDPGAGDGERGAQIMGDVVADALELLEQPRDFVQHQIDRARHFVDVAALIG